MCKYKTVIVDDHKLFRKGIRMILSDMAEIDVIAECNDGAEFIDLINKIEPDLVFMDIKMPKIDGIEATKKALAIYPNINIIALSMFGDIDYYNKMVESGVRGFVLKNSDIDDLKKAIEAISNGTTFFSQELLLNLVKNYQAPKQEKTNLTARELEVLEQICLGFSNGEIASKLFLSQRTIESHRANILSKTNTKNSIQLVVFSIKNGLFTVS